MQYQGAKYILLDLLKAVVPQQCSTYVEPFFGSGTLFFNREPVKVEVINDCDDQLVALFRVLQDKEKFEKLRHKLMYTPYARSELARAINISNETLEDEVDMAWAVFVRHNMGIYGLYNGMSSSWHCGKVRNSAVNYIRRLTLLDHYANRIRHAQIDNRDAMKVIDALDSPDTVFYCDPPYVLETRKSILYTYEQDNDWHRSFVELCLKVEGAMIISGYDHEIYYPLVESGWQLIKKKALSSFAVTLGKNKANHIRYECIWRNPRACEMAPYRQEEENPK